MQVVFFWQAEQLKSKICSSPKNLSRQASKSTGVPFSTSEGTGAIKVNC